MRAREGLTESPWRQRDFRLVWAGGLISGTGDWLLLIALPVFVFTRTGSGLSTAALFIVEVLVAMVVGPLGGSLVDRWDLRRTLIATNVVQAIGLVPLLAVTAARVWPAFVVVGVESALRQLNDPASVALLPRLVGREQLVVANAANASRSSLARLIGSPLGGIAVAIGGLGTVVAVDAVTFLVVAVATAFVRSDSIQLTVGKTSDGPEIGVRAGLRMIRRNKPLPALVGILSLLQVAQGFFVVLFVVFVVDELHGGGSQVGLIRATMAVGSIAGTVVIARLAPRVDAARLFAVGTLGLGVAELLFWNATVVTTALWLYLVLFALSGVPGAALEVGAMTTLQRASPPHAIGRVSGVVGAGSAAGNAVGSLLAGVLVGPVGLRVLVNVQAMIYPIGAVLVLRTVVGPRFGDGAAAEREPRGASR